MAAAFGSGSGSGPGSSSEDEHPAPAAPAPAASSSTVTVTINTNQNQEGPQAQAHHGTLNTWLNITGTSGTSGTSGTGPGATPSAAEECALSSSHRQRKSRLKRKSPVSGGEANPPPPTRQAKQCKTITATGRLMDPNLGLRDKGFVVKDKKMHCSLCYKDVATRSSSIQQHLVTQKHQAAVANQIKLEAEMSLMEAAVTQHFGGAMAPTSTPFNVLCDR